MPHISFGRNAADIFALTITEASTHPGCCGDLPRDDICGRSSLYTAQPGMSHMCITIMSLPPQSQCERSSRLAADTAPHVTPFPGRARPAPPPGSSRPPNCATGSHAHVKCDADPPPAADVPPLLHMYAPLISRCRRAARRWCLALQDQDTPAAPRMSGSRSGGCTDAANNDSRRPRRVFRGLSQHRRADLCSRLLYVQPQGRAYYCLRAVIRTRWP